MGDDTVLQSLGVEAFLGGYIQTGAEAMSKPHKHKWGRWSWYRSSGVVRRCQIPRCIESQWRPESWVIGVVRRLNRPTPRFKRVGCVENILDDEALALSLLDKTLYVRIPPRKAKP